MLEKLEIHSVRRYVGHPYEWVSATAVFAVDPIAPGNNRIVDLDMAPRDADGRVRFDADVRLLRPTSGGNRRALLVPPNRGMTLGIPFDRPLPETFAFDPAVIPAATDAFLLRRGWTIAWCGWQWDVQRAAGALGLTAPVARVRPGWTRVEFRSDTDQPDHALSDSGPLFRHTDYPSTDLDDPDAVLTVRTTPMGARQIVPRSRWRFTSPIRVAVDGGFRAFHYYELKYRTALAPVVGAGLLALRDFGAHLRREHDHLFAGGASQSGRVLRQLLYDGLNVDEAGARVFDGVFSQLASARRGEFNQRHGQPALSNPVTGAYGTDLDTTGLLRRQRGIGGVPKIMSVNSAWEYWRGDGALVHQHARTGEDLPEDPDARVHLVSGTDHIDPAPFARFLPLANPAHSLDPTLVHRALFVQLEQWVCDGRTPEPSQVPRHFDGTATTRDKVLAAFPDAALGCVENLPWTPDNYPDGAWPQRIGKPLVAIVSTVDEHGNELAGIRLPEVATAAAAYTGWNPRKHVDGLPDVLYEMAGSRLPTLTTVPQPDEAAVRAAAQALVARRFLLPEDADHAVNRAMDQHRTHSAGLPDGA
ncbi:alpha/beta hydrolase domain-containing protein [Kutzneria sp. NPDC052558]|uniref:alpha/beta hydrolase domain-containing protein n=1 Tax=Kutzneria sp. NPDC052558 TaxID=3364121 RepID=UPI0037C52CF3